MSTTQPAVTSVKVPISGIGTESAAIPVAVPGTAATPGGTENALSGAGDMANGAMSALGQTTDGLFAWGSYFQALALLFLIVAILFAALWLLKRRGGIKLLTRQGNLLLESRMALGPKKSILVVRFLNKRILLGVTDQQITMLTELPTDEDVTAYHASDAPGTADFSAHIARAARNDPEHAG